MIKKIILASVLSIILISGYQNVFAAKTLQDLGLTAESVKFLSQAEVDQLLADANATSTATSSVVAPVLPDLENTPANTVNCFDYYSFGSIQTDLKLGVSTGVVGVPLTFSGFIRNTNPYPIVQGKLIVRIFKLKDTSVKDINGPDVVGEFVVLKNIGIPAGGKVPISFDWKVPNNLDSGKYRAATFFTVADKFNLSGLSFTDDVIGNSVEFSIKGKSSIVRFDKSTVTINDAPYHFATYPPHVDQNVDAVIGAELVNSTTQSQLVTVTWKVYSWDAQGPGNFIKEYKDMITVGAQSRKSISYKVSDKTYPVYYVRAEAEYAGTQSILGIRFVRDGVHKLRINFPSIMSYPLVRGKETTLFSCLHATSDSLQPQNGVLKLILEDTKGNIVHSYTYQGPVTGMMMGVKDSFTPKVSLDNFKLRAILLQDDKVVDEAVMEYSCRSISPDDCSRDTDLSIIALVFAVLIIVLSIIKRRRSSGKLLSLWMLVGIALSICFLSPHDVSAKEVQSNQTINKGFKYYAGGGVGGSTPGWGLGLVSPNITVTYIAQVTNAVTGLVVQDGDTITQGSILNFSFIPHISDHIYWFGTGYTEDSPYGEWIANSAPPAVSCSAKDFVTNYGTAPYSYQVYIPVVIDPPVKTLTNQTGLSGCTAINSTTQQCTVTGTGSINPTFSFATTTGKFYYRYKHIPSGAFTDQTCVGNNIPMEVITSPTTHDPYDIVIPAQAITYDLTIPVTNNPPSNPVITGPTTGYVGVAYSFTAVSTDPDNDTVKYGIDWANTGTVNEWVPSSDFVADETVQTATYTWNSPGTYSFKIKAQDSKGAGSGWSTYTITIVADRCTNISGGQSTPLFQAHSRDYFYSLDDGQLYFTPSSAAAGSACTVDMCADTSAIEASIPSGLGWPPSAPTPYERYSCVSTTQTCSCSGRNKVCIQGGIIVSNAPDASCNLDASCSYPTPSGSQVVFNFTAVNVIGSLINGGTSPKTIPATGAGVITETRTISNSGDGQTDSATCSYSYDNTTDPQILNFTATKIVEQGTSCVFSWQTQDLATCSLSGQNVAASGVYPFSTALGRNITKTLTCQSADTVPVTKSATATCLVRPAVKEE